MTKHDTCIQTPSSSNAQASAGAKTANSLLVALGHISTVKTVYQLTAARKHANYSTQTRTFLHANTETRKHANPQTRIGVIKTVLS